MNAIDFCYWLQGAIEINEGEHFTEDQQDTIKNHLDLVFVHHIDPLRESQTTASKTDLDQAHGNDINMRC